MGNAGGNTSVLDEGIRATIVTLYKQGLPVSTIAETVNRNESTIYSWLHRQPQLLEWQENYRKPRRRKVVIGEKIEGKQLLYAPNPLEEPVECPECFRMVYPSSIEPSAPCLACQLRSTKEEAIVV